MSLENKEKSCSLCHAYLFQEDDVVYCPECGAPHHRECYDSIGHCALEEFHGTENQYDKVKRAAEEAKAKEEPKYEEPPRQNNYQTPFGTFTSIDFLGGVAPDTEIDDGVTARDAAKFVFSNTMRYIPKFARSKKTSWNFLALFYPTGWFFSRKMYKNGIIAMAFEIISMLLTVPLQNTLINMGMGSTTEMPKFLSENMDKIPQSVMIVGFIGSLLFIAFRLISAIFGDWFYKCHVVSQVREINAKSIDKDIDYRKKGGVNLFAFLLGVMAVQYITTIIVTLIVN